MRPLFIYHLYRPSTESGLIGILTKFDEYI